MYADIGAPLLDNALRGFNSCVLAYGQTGSGKTHTMMGGVDGHGRLQVADPAAAGLIPRLCDDLFRRIAPAATPLARTTSGSRPVRLSWTVKASYVEVYNENVTDLLGGRKAVALQQSSTGFDLSGAAKLPVTSAEQVLALIAKGNEGRATGATSMNEHSSRSHAVVVLFLQETMHTTQRNGATTEQPTRSSTIKLVDLAGSERQSDTGATGARLKEANNINKSLTTLGMVIRALGDPKRALPVPYRDSKLTKLLQDSFGGNSKTTMIATVGPSVATEQATL